MNSYRLYMMDRGHIRAAKDLMAASDEEAIALAEDLRDGEPAELWRGSSRVTAFDISQERFA